MKSIRFSLRSSDGVADRRRYCELPAQVLPAPQQYLSTPRAPRPHDSALTQLRSEQSRLQPPRTRERRTPQLTPVRIGARRPQKQPTALLCRYADSHI